jgi:hypothetical protein
VRYEDLILHPEETLEALFDYLDLDRSSTMLDQVIQSASKTTREMKQHQTSTDPQASIGRWQHDLDSSLQKVCVEAFGDILQEFNYA